MHLGATIVLYASAIALINLAFSIINYALPDALAGSFYRGSIAWPISMLIVLVPLLYVLEWLIKRDAIRMPEKKEIWIRRWRIYLTLFLTGATIIGDLIALINTYVGGEITGRFAYKILAVLIIAGVVFVYYILERSTDDGQKKTTQKIFAYAGILLALAGVIGGFIVVGSPGTQRAIRFDNQRVSDLSNIQRQILNNWQRKGSLPSTLAELSDSISGFKVPQDPESKMDYEYNVKNATAFELCATFNRKTEDVKGRGESYPSMSITYPADTYYPGMSSDSWNHLAGRACFERTIDPEKYPTNKPIPITDTKNNYLGGAKVDYTR